MRVTRKIVFDWTGQVLEHDYFHYEGTVDLCKGSDSAKAVRDKEFAMQQKAFDRQMAMFDKLSGAFSKDLTGKQGFDPQMLAAMKASFLNSNDATFNQAGGMVREALGARGNTGGNPSGGDVTRGLSGLLSARAGSQSGGLLNVDIQNAQQAITNKFNAGSILSGNAATLTGTQGVSANAMSNALNQYMSSMNSGFGASFLSSFGSTLGHTLGGGNASKGAGWLGAGG